MKLSIKNHCKMIFSLFLIISVITVSLFQTPTVVKAKKKASWPATPEIYAETGVLIEATTGTVLYDKGKDQQMYPASITKVLTALVAIENTQLDEKVTFSHDAIFSLEPEAAHIAMKEGEKITMEDCLYGLLLASANEVANAMAEHTGGSIDEFATMMNERAKKAGAKNSNFTNPSGLFDENHYTTAYDMAMVTRAALQHPEFMKVEATTSYTIDKTDMTDEPRYLNNRHKMLFVNDYRYYEGIQGGKTGYVDQSGNTLITFAKRGDLQLISVVMKSNSENVYNDTKLLLDYGFDNFQVKNISTNETSFDLNESGFFSDIGYLFQNTTTASVLNEDDIVVIPNSVTFGDLTHELVWNEDNSSAQISYYYGKRSVGSTTLNLSATTDQSGESSSKDSSSKKDNDTKKDSNDKKKDSKSSSDSKKSSDDKNNRGNSKAIQAVKKVAILILKIIGVIILLAVILFAILLIRSFVDQKTTRRRKQQRRRRRKQHQKNSSHKRRSPRNPRY